jgi:predicted nucleic-acid-binding protein
MRAVDTNVLVRLLTRDDVRQANAAEAFVASGAWVSHLALVEAMWVLDAVYGLSADRIARAVEMLLDHRDLVLQEAETVAAALALFRERPRLGFADCMMLETARRAGHLPLGTFDQKLGRIAGAQRL